MATKGIAREPNVPCPRCGNLKFEIRTSTRDEWNRDAAAAKQFNQYPVIGAKMKCTVCQLVWTGEGWKDQTGEDWSLAQAGT